MIDLIVVIFGCIIGSFLTVCVYRIPLGRSTGLEELLSDDEEEQEEEEGAEEEAAEGGSLDSEDDLLAEPNSPHFEQRVTIMYPRRSFCPHCGEQLKWYHNIPVLSYLFQLGKCGFCKERISWQYPTIELLTGLFAWLSYTSFEPAGAIVAFIFACGLIVISFIDLEYFIIPNVITYPAFLLGLVFGGVQSLFGIFESPPFVTGIVQSAFGVLSGAGLLLGISLFYTYVRKKQGLGLGDVKLLAVVGAFFGPHGAFYTIFVGSLLGSVLGISLLFIGRGKWSSYIPFGPYLATATALYIFMAEHLTALLNDPTLQAGGYR